MKIEEFKKLEKRIQNQDFYTGYKNINKTLYYLSILGNFGSMFLAFFFMSKLLMDSVTYISNEYIIWGISFLLLGSLELIKREVFDKFSLEFIKSKFKISKSVLPLMFFSCVIIFFSFYSSLNGAKEFTSKSDMLDQNVKEVVTSYKDSLNNIYNVKITDKETEIKALKEKLDKKDKEQTEIESSERLNRNQKNRVKDLKEERATIKSDIQKLEDDIKVVKDDQKLEIEAYKGEVLDDTDKEKNKNKSNSFVFIIISTIIEFLILIGIYFNEYYNNKSYMDIREKINRDPRYQKWVSYESILDIIYTNDAKVNDKLPSQRNMMDFMKMNGVSATNKDLTDCLKLFGALKILRVAGGSRYIIKDRDASKESLRKHFNIE